jgi:hypothetical protein
MFFLRTSNAGSYNPDSELPVRSLFTINAFNRKSLRGQHVASIADQFMGQHA